MSLYTLDLLPTRREFVDSPGVVFLWLQKTGSSLKTIALYVFFFESSVLPQANQYKHNFQHEYIYVHVHLFILLIIVDKMFTNPSSTYVLYV